MTSSLEELKENFISFGITIKDEELLNEIIPLCSEYNLDEDTITQKFIAFNLNKKQDNVLHRKSIDLFKLHLSESLTASKSTKSVLKERNDDLLICDNSNLNFLDSYCDNSTLRVFEKDSDEKPNISNINASFSVPSDSTISSSWPKGEKIDIAKNLSSSVNFEIDEFYQTDILRENPNDRNQIIQEWSQNVLKDIMSTVDLVQVKNSCSQTQDTNASLSQILSGENTEDSSSLNFKAFDEKIFQDALYFGKITNISKNVNNQVKKITVNEKNPSKKVMGFMDIDEDLSSYQQSKLSQSQIGISPFSTTLLPIRFDIASDNVPVSFILGEPVVFVGTNPSKTNILVKKQLQLESTFLSKFTSLDSLILVASGPFQRYDKPVDDDSILSKVVKAIQDKKPNLVLINGPLIDTNHPRLLDYAKGTFDDLFVKFRNLLIKAALEVEAKIIFISSYKEFGQKPMYPTGPNTQVRGISKEVLNSRVFFGPDPCFITLKSQQTLERGPSIVISSTDVIMHLSGEETSLGSANKTQPEMDRITRICKKILSTGSIYPMNPCNFDVPMNYRLWSKNCNFKPLESSTHHEKRLSPHCFIMPSFINFSTKLVNNALFVNSGLASRLYGDGSFTLIQLKKSSEKIESLKEHFIMNTFKL